MSALEWSAGVSVAPNVPNHKAVCKRVSTRVFPQSMAYLGRTLRDEVAIIPVVLHALSFITSSIATVYEHKPDYSCGP